MTKRNEYREQIDRVANDTYDTIVQEGGYDSETIHRRSICHRVAKLMVEQLVDVAPYAVQETRDIVPGWTNHSYVDVLPDGDLIADPTWQQFVDANQIAEDAPKVLIGSRSEVVDRLREYGVRDEILQIWQK